MRSKDYISLSHIVSIPANLLDIFTYIQLEPDSLIDHPSDSKSFR